MSTTVLKISGLSKKYKKVQALHQLNLTVERGMVFGILGPNGSGKTTTLGILLGILRPSEGTYSWFDNGTADSNRKKIGALLETPNFYPYLNATRNLRIVAKIKQLDNVEERIEKVLKAVNLYGRHERNFKTFSLGMKQRLAIASALLNDPEVLVLDEPTNGLDPQGIAEIRALIQTISKEGKTILIASHQLDEIEKVCTDVIILKDGKALRQSKIESLTRNSRQVIVSCSDTSSIIAHLHELSGITNHTVKGNQLFLDVDESITTADLNRFFFEKGIVLSELREIHKSLEDQFLEITKA